MLTRAIFSEGCKAVAAGMNPMDLKRGIEKAVAAVVDELKAKTKMISTSEEIAQVCGVDEYPVYVNHLRRRYLTRVGRAISSPGGHHLRQRRLADRRADRSRDGARG